MFYQMLMDMDLPKFDIDQGAVAPSCFKSHTNNLCPFIYFFFRKKFCLMSGLKFTLPDVTSFLADNLSGFKKYIQACLYVRSVYSKENTYSGPFFSLHNIFTSMNFRNLANFQAFGKSILLAKYKIKIQFQIFRCLFCRKISFISKNKSTRNIETSTFVKISTGKNIAA